MLHLHAPSRKQESSGSTLLKVGLAVVAVGAAAGVTYTVLTRRKAAAARAHASYDADAVVPLHSVDDLQQAASTAGEQAQSAASAVADKVEASASAAADKVEEATDAPEEHHTFQGDLDHVAHQIADSFVEDIELPDGPLPE